MLFTMQVNMNGAAFDPDPDPELERILHGLARRASCTLAFHGEGTILDINGATVGKWAITEDDLPAPQATP